MSTTINTPPFRASYPHLFEPRKNELNGKNEYSVTALFKPGENLKKIEDAIKAAITKKWGPDSKKWPRDLKTPLRDQFERAKEDEDTGSMVLPDGYVKGAKFLNLKSSEPPGVVDQNVQRILDTSEIYAGVWMIAKVNFYAYDKKGNRGVSAGLLHVQKYKDDAPLGGSRGKVEDAFTPIVGQEEDSSDLGI